MIEELASAGAGALLGGGTTALAARLSAPALRRGDWPGFWRLQLLLVPVKLALVGAALAALSRSGAFRPLPFAVALAAGWFAAGTPLALRQRRAVFAGTAASPVPGTGPDPGRS